MSAVAPKRSPRVDLSERTYRWAVNSDDRRTWSDLRRSDLNYSYKEARWGNRTRPPSDTHDPHALAGVGVFWSSAPDPTRGAGLLGVIAVARPNIRANRSPIELPVSLSDRLMRT